MCLYGLYIMFFCIARVLHIRWFYHCITYSFTLYDLWWYNIISYRLNKTTVFILILCIRIKGKNACNSRPNRDCLNHGHCYCFTFSIRLRLIHFNDKKSYLHLGRKMVLNFDRLWKKSNFNNFIYHFRLLSYHHNIFFILKIWKTGFCDIITGFVTRELNCNLDIK